VERLAYGPDPSQHGELTRGGHDVAVLIHGGFWRAAYGLDLMRDLAADLAARGWTTWNLEYRRLGKGGGWPATLEDVAAGVDHLAELVGGGPPRRVVAVGHSAGGQLAAWAATRERPRVRLDAVVVQAGVVDLRLAWELRLSGGVVADFLGAPPDEVPDRCAAASPRERLPLGVPVLLVHGALDDDVPPRMSREFAAAARAAGDTVTLHEVDEEGHMEHVAPRSALWRRVTAWL
jgi:acetyl esterase/lipase